jgi:hypothetical protein
MNSCIKSAAAMQYLQRMELLTTKRTKQLEQSIATTQCGDTASAEVHFIFTFKQQKGCLM